MAGETHIIPEKNVPANRTKSANSVILTAEFINKIWSSGTREALVEVVAEYAEPVFGASGSAVFLHNDNGTLTASYVELEHEPVFHELTIYPGSGNLVFDAFTNVYQLNIPALTEEHMGGLDMIVDLSGSPALATPFGGEVPKGVLFLVRQPEKGDFSPADAAEAGLVAYALGGTLKYISGERKSVERSSDVKGISDLVSVGPDPETLAVLMEEQQKREDELILFNRIGRKSLTTVDTAEFLNFLVASIRESFGYYNVAIYIIDERDPDRLVLKVIDGEYSDILLPNYNIKVSEGIIGYVASTGDYVVANDARKDPRYTADPVDIPERSECALPIIIEGRVIGVLDVQQNKKNAFDDGRVKLLRALADQAALAVHKAKLFEKQEIATREANILLQISSRLGQSMDMVKSLDYLAEETASAFGADASAVILLSEANKLRNVKAVFGLPEGTKNALLSQGMAVDDVIVGQMEKEPKPIAIEDVSVNAIEGIKKMAEVGAKSILLAPIRAKGKLVGILGALWLNAKKKFDEADLNLAAGVAIQAGITIENVLYFENLTRQANFLSVIGTIANEASRLPPVGELIESALRLLLEYAGLERGIIFLYDHERNNRHTFRSSGLSEAAESSVIARLREDHTLWEEGNEVSIVEEVGEDDIIASAFPSDERPAAYLGIPLFAKKAYTGHVYLFSDEPMFSDRYETNSIWTICEQLSTFIENSLLFSQNIEQLEQMRTLLETSKQISSSLDPEEIIYNIAQEVKNLISADECTVFLLNRDGGYLEPIVSLTSYPEEMLKVHLKVGEGITGNVALTGVGEYINDPISDPRSKHVEGTPESETESILCVPLISKEDVIGVMTLHRLAANPFTDHDLQLVTLFGTQVAGLIENARMFDRVLSSMTIAEEQRRKLDAIFASVSEAFLVTDSNLRIIEINTAAEEFLGTTQEKVVNRYVNSVIDDEDIIEKMEEALINPPEEIPSEFVHFKKDPESGSEIYYRFTIDHLKDAEANILGLVISFIEITDQVALEKMKDNFIANVSHELRTPLTSIIGSTELMLDDSTIIDSPFSRFVNIINKEAVRLRNLVDSILDFSLLEAGKFNLELEPTSIKDICGEIIHRYKNVAEDYGVSLKYTPAEDLGVVAVDQRLLDSILSNLVKNGIYFNKRGGTVEIASYKGEGNDDYLVIEVADTGKGMTPDHIEKMFSKFYQADNSSTRSVGGTGIGLSIVKKAVDAHGGYLEVTSESGIGSVFTCFLPLRTP
jgi:PAS domain S-box-containing protein